MDNSDEAAVTVVRAESPRGEIALRERSTPAGIVHELIVAGVFAMDSRDPSTEADLASRTVAAVGAPTRVLVGGLGLGYTALEVLKDRRVERVDVVEIEEDLIAWARLGLTPTLTVIGRHPRVTLHAGDVADVLSGQDAALLGPWDLVLLDVDNGPSFLIHPGNARLYDSRTLEGALGCIAPRGMLAIWAAQREPALLETLAPLAEVQEVLLPLEREGRPLTYALYLARPRD